MNCHGITVRVKREPFEEKCMPDKEVVNHLEKIVGREHVLTSPEELYVYSYDGTQTWRHLPDVIVFPENAIQISDILKFANNARIPAVRRHRQETKGYFCDNAEGTFRTGEEYSKLITGAVFRREPSKFHDTAIGQYHLHTEDILLGNAVFEA